MKNNKTVESKKVKKGELTRIRILEGAIKEIAMHGFEGLVLTDVAKLAGVTRGNLLQHFQSRENLIDQTSTFLGSQGRQFTLEHLSKAVVDKNRVLAYIEATFAWARQRRDQAILLVYLLNRAGYDKSSNFHIQNIFLAARHRLAMDILDSGKRSSKSGMSPQLAEDLALQIHTNLLGYIVQIAPMENNDNLVNFERQCLETTRIILRSHGII